VQQPRQHALKERGPPPCPRRGGPPPAGHPLASGLKESERALLFLIAVLSQEEDAEVTSGSVFESVQEYVPIGRIAYHSQLKRLRETGIVSMRERGKHRKITLQYAPEEVIAACERS